MNRKFGFDVGLELLEDCVVLGDAFETILANKVNQDCSAHITSPLMNWLETHGVGAQQLQELFEALIIGQVELRDIKLHVMSEQGKGLGLSTEVATDVFEDELCWWCSTLIRVLSCMEYDPV